MSECVGRRNFIGSLLLAGAGVLVSGCARNDTAGENQKEKSKMAESEEELITPGEDLMREHGVLERLLLIYEEVDRRNRANDPQMKALNDASGIIRSFIEDYHEKLEEEYVFPRFEKAGKQVDLVKTLKAQHDAGRRITTRIRNIAASEVVDSRTTNELSTLIHEFVRMYRPHAAREDTVIFREFPEVVGASNYKELGETFEEREHKLFGESGFAGIVDKVANIEKDLGIYELAQFTPKQ